MDKETYNEINRSNIIYSNKTDALLLKTGQTTSYHAGDDGDLEKGISHSYTVLTTGQYAGSTNVTINSKTYAFPNACVQDNRTGLMWARTVPQSDIGPAEDGKLFWEQYTLDDETCTCNATNKTITADAGTPFDTGALCVGRIFTITGSGAGNNGTYTVASITTLVITVEESLNDEASVSLDFATVGDLIWDLVDEANANELAGYSDWRMPNVVELESILDYGQVAPAIDTTVFSSAPASYTWCSTSYSNSTKAFAVHFGDATLAAYQFIKSRKKFFVRLVRN